MTDKPNWKTLTFIIGGVVGLASGLAAAYLIVKQREESGESLKLTSGDGAKIGLGIVSLLKMVSETGRK
jgi:hypothetical protein